MRMLERFKNNLQPNGLFNFRLGGTNKSLLLLGSLIVLIVCVCVSISVIVDIQILGVHLGTASALMLMGGLAVSNSVYQEKKFNRELEEKEAYINETAMQLSDTHKQVEGYAAILKGQIEGISDITEDASMDLMKALYEIENSIQDSIDSIEKSQRDTDSCQKQSASEFEIAAKRVVEIKEMIEQQQQQQLSDNQAIQDVMKEVENLKELTDLVKNIASQTNLLALNAAIEAARAGEYGRGFAVVADQVRILSAQSSEAADKIEFGIKSALDAAQIQGQKMLNSTRSKDTCNLLSGFSETLENITEHYRALERVSPKMLACFSESASAVAMKVSGAIAKIQFQDIIRQRAEHVKYEQDAIVNLFGQFSIYINERKKFDEAFNLSAIQMFENYVMEDQRKIHFDINKSGSEESKCEYQEAREPKIELF